MWRMVSLLLVLATTHGGCISTTSPSTPNPTACGDIIRHQGYQQPAVDLVASLLQLQRDIDRGVFQGEYAFEAALHRLIQSAHEDHLSLSGGIMSAFTFGSQYDIASVSLDGKEVPKVYITGELIFPKITIALLMTINDEDVVDFLTWFAAVNSFGNLEPHADWNMLMRSAALDIQGSFEVFGGAAPFYPGDSIIFGFENGTTLGPFPWKAIFYSQGDTGPLETGGDFYNFFVLGFYPASYRPEEPDTTSVPVSTSTTVASSSSSSTPTTTPYLWTPYPLSDVSVNRSYSDSMEGFFLRESSMAVLSIPHFNYYGEDAQTFSTTIEGFLRGSRQAGLQRVVIDLQQNRGGFASPFAGSHRRTHPMADVLGSTLTEYWNDIVHNTTYARLSANEWVATARLDAATGQNFTSWEDFYGPAGFYDRDGFTKTARHSILNHGRCQERYNTSSSIFDQEAAGFNVDGYGSRTPPHQGYRAEDIIILSDGLCSSACALLMEMMHHEAGVRTVTVGGRPTYG
ncbi:uncharacterized protein ACLA_043830 [Aspergillus clavatus NRRL 1]|uniref:CPAF-like PDZ domain-containing protein n=1 Tax=Aspergillus clavatus (strain ATCC 1007 / CBS 513.65 / DSM 816 / NCTC 3887 / NRRL 1 / QM 1276 / 107) TaxID=344612 RepID=A1C8M6_ASPCL|nr:uncharacterized protein ACLA_043830 [Aspergillus clavatus NRRL 1]EAW13663.1 conserved hypothetical protein [Aspergillus clavatus NRRL 1]